MSRILAYTSPARGHLYPLTPILLELRARGHEVSLRTLASQVPRMRDLGFDAEPLDPRVEQLALDDWKESGAKARLNASASAFAGRAQFDVPALRAAIDQARPDAVIVDTNSWGAQAAAEAWGGPWASFVPYPTPLSSRDAPPFGLGLRPAHGRLGRLRDRALRPLVMGTVERATLPRYNEVRAGLGLAAIRTADDLYTAAPLTIYLTAEPFEYPRSDWPDSYVLVGPCEWDPSDEAPEWLTGIDRPIVLVTTSSEYQGDERLARAALEALADQDVFVVATVPSAEPSGFPVTPNGRVERFAPHAAILDRAACAITHGGMGATQKALARGVPVCAVPFGRDQFDVARRVEECGAGTRLPARRLTPERLGASVRTAMARADGARRIAKAFASAGGPPSAGDAVEARLLGLPTAGAPGRRRTTGQ
jgi:MGT family glycosyltransferase